MSAKDATKINATGKFAVYDVAALKGKYICHISFGRF
jgi:hypothetical protein